KKSVREVRRTFRTQYGPAFRFHLPDIAIMECASCKKRFLTKAQKRQLVPAYNARIRTHLGLLAPSEWTRARKILGLSRTSLEKTLGLKPADSSRIELDRAIPSLTEDLLVRMVLRGPHISTCILQVLADRDREKKLARKRT
ncbi:MAG: hypothetical protein AAB372_02915, partial [Patescibacteria group bacterium]